MRWPSGSLPTASQKPPNFFHINIIFVIDKLFSLIKNVIVVQRNRGREMDTAAIAERAMDRDAERYHCTLSNNEEYLEGRIQRLEDAFDLIMEACDTAMDSWEELEAVRDLVIRSTLMGEEFVKLQLLQARMQGLFEASFLDLRDKVRAGEKAR